MTVPPPERPKHGWTNIPGPRPDETLIAAKCVRCSRFWFNLIGSSEGVLHRVQGYTEVHYDPVSRKIVRHNPRTGTTASNVVVERDAGPPDGTVTRIGKVALPNHAYERYKVRCHPRCGVRKPFLRELLNREFADAVTRGHADVRL